MGLQRPFFYSKGDRPGAAKLAGKRNARWADAYAELIANGHDPDRIGKYTERQINLYLQAIIRRDKRKRAELLLDVNKAYAGGEKANEHLKALAKEP